MTNNELKLRTEIDKQLEAIKKLPTIEERAAKLTKLMLRKQFWLFVRICKKYHLEY